MNKPDQRRCPYTLRPLEELSELSREHIIPDALGGPNGYSVTACRASNSKFGETTDAAFLNDPLVAMLRSHHGVEGRNGPAKWKMDGETVSDGRPVEITFTQEAVDVYHKKPVDVVEDENGKGYRIVAPDAQLKKVMEQLKKGLAKKGMTLSEPTVTRDEQQTLHGRMQVDLNVLLAGLMKIAYLAAFDFIGDAFLDDPLNPEWQKAIRVTNAEEAKKVRIHGSSFDKVAEQSAILLPRLAAHEHGIAIVKLNQTGPVAMVQLFGNSLLRTCVSVSDTNGFGLKEADGIITIVDSIGGQMRQESWMLHLERMTQTGSFSQSPLS